LIKEHKYYTYILTHNRNHIFYVGVTNNIERRVFEHRNGTYGSHVGKFNIKKLVYFEVHQWIQEAIKREKIIKKWKRQWKISIITDQNPNWRDLSADWDLSKFNEVKY
jgi:putative endonuclease